MAPPTRLAKVILIKLTAEASHWASWRAAILSSRLHGGEGDMAVTGMNHFTILTDDVDGTCAFYLEFLGLQPGWRPPFDFPGAWLYSGAEALLHVIGGRKVPEAPGVIDHMAFSATGLDSVLGKLSARGLAYDLRALPGRGTWQLFFFDPNGARVELDFAPHERASGAGGPG